MRTRLFLRTAEFLWQEGHTAHATKEEALEEATRMLDVYATFSETYMAIPVIKGVKTENERFAGAVETYCIEGMMQDGKALQMGTSHFLGQNFAKAFDVTFQNKEGKIESVWATSWGVSTRLMGALIMVHSDDEGLVIPPKLAPIHVVLVPIYRKEEERETVVKRIHEIADRLKAVGVKVKVDDRDTYKPGYKFAEWEQKGIPVRLALGPRDLEQNSIELARRDLKTKEVVPIEGLEIRIQALLEDIQASLFNKAKLFLETRTYRVDTWEAFVDVLENKQGFALAHWDGSGETEAKIKEMTKGTIRCIPLDNPTEAGACILTGAPSTQRVLFAKSY
jgi:prolyl-tRNA synthetase